MFGEPAALLVGIVSTLGTVALTIWASRRFGLPGLAREVDTQSAKLIDRLTQNNALLTILPVLRRDLAADGVAALGGGRLPIEAIADILGHSTTRVTADLYRHRVESFSRLAADKMQEALGG